MESEVFNMAFFIGTDIIEIERVKKAYERNKKFLNRIFTETEIEYLQNRNMGVQHIAGMFSSKESVSKALGSGIYGFKWKNIEIRHNKAGAPEVKLYGRAKQIAEHKGIEEVKISISHSREYVVTFAMGIGDENK